MTNTKLNLNDANVCENLVWSYLNDSKKCKQKLPFQLNRLCDFQKEPYSNVSCSHCRFRKTVISVKSLAVSKTSEKNGKFGAMSMLLCLHHRGESGSIAPFLRPNRRIFEEKLITLFQKKILFFDYAAKVAQSNHLHTYGLDSFAILNFLNKKLKDDKWDDFGCPTVGFRICVQRR